MRQFAILALFALLVAGPAKASVVIDFNNATPGTLLTADYHEDGFTMQTLSGHYDMNPTGGTGNTTWLGIDRIFAAPLSTVRFTSDAGLAFGLLSVDVIGSGRAVERLGEGDNVGGVGPDEAQAQVRGRRGRREQEGDGRQQQACHRRIIPPSANNEPEHSAPAPKLIG